MRIIVIIFSLCFLCVPLLTCAKTIHTTAGKTYDDAVIVDEGKSWVRVKHADGYTTLQKDKIQPEEVSNAPMLIIAALVLLNSLTMAYMGRLHCATLWAGRVIPDPRLLPTQPEGYQNAMVPGYAGALQLGLILSQVAILAVASLTMAWYFGVVAVVGTFILSRVLGFLVPNSLHFYLKHLRNLMSERHERYVLNGDVERAVTSQMMAEALTNLVAGSVDGIVTVPSLSEARSASLNCMFPESETPPVLLGERPPDKEKRLPQVQLSGCVKPPLQVRRVFDDEKPLMVQLIEEEKIPSQMQQRDPGKPALEMRRLRDAAQRGSIEAQYELGLCYRDGIGTEKDWQVARKMFQQAAKQGHQAAERCLFFMAEAG